MKHLFPVITALFLLLSFNLHCQVNLGFEDGNFNGWSGTVQDREIRRVSSFSKPNQPGPLKEGFLQHCILKAGLNDPMIPLLSVVPEGKQFVARVGNTVPGGEIVTLKQTFRVDSSNISFSYSFAIILEDPVDEYGIATEGHEGLDRPYFTARLLNESGNEIQCATYIVVAATALTDFAHYCVAARNDVNSTKNVGCPQGSAGYDSSRINTASSSQPASALTCTDFNTQNTDIYYKDWMKVGILLDEYYGQNITLEFAAADCIPNGHRAYAYVSAEASPVQNNSNPLTIRSNKETKILTAPSGFTNYEWTSDEGIIIANPDSREIQITRAGSYKVSMRSLTSSQCTYSQSYQVKEDTSSITGVMYTNLSTIKAYPNPAQGQLVIEVPEAAKYQFDIISLTGKSYSSDVIYNSNNAILNVKGFPRGAYFIGIHGPQTVKYMKVMLE